MLTWAVAYMLTHGVELPPGIPLCAIVCDAVIVWAIAGAIAGEKP